MIWKPFYVSQANLLPASRQQQAVMDKVNKQYDRELENLIAEDFFSTIEQMFGVGSLEWRDFNKSLFYIKECAERYYMERLPMVHLQEYHSRLLHDKSSTSFQVKGFPKNLILVRNRLMEIEFYIARRLVIDDDPNNVFYEDFYSTAKELPMRQLVQHDEAGGTIPGSKRYLYEVFHDLLPIDNGRLCTKMGQNTPIEENSQPLDCSKTNLFNSKSGWFQSGGRKATMAWKRRSNSFD